MDIVFWTNGFGRQLVAEATATYYSDGNLFAVIPRARMTYDVGEPFTVLRIASVMGRRFNGVESRRLLAA